MASTPKNLCLAIALLAGSSNAVLAAPDDVPVTFVCTNLGTTVGQSVFVAGILPQLGGWDQTRAVKLVVDGSSCVGTVCSWSATIALPPGASYQYKFIKRNDCATCYADSGNVVWGNYGDTQASTPVGLAAPFTGKTVFYYSGWSSVSILYSNTISGGWTLQAMTSVSNGLWRADGLNHTGETNLMFVFTDNQGNWDNPDGIANYNYETPLDASVVRNGQVYNYWPPTTVGTNRVVTFSMTPTNGLQGRTIRVYLPRGFSENTTKRYPVLYMHDGNVLFNGMVSGLSGYGWGADTNANNLIRFGRMRETVIVGIDNTSDRTCEYDPPGCGNICGSPEGGLYTSFIVDQLKRYIDNTYSITAGRTLTDADNTGVLGSSYGGLISAYIGWQRSDVFHRVGCMSPSFDVCYPMPAPDSRRPIRVYLDSGDRDFESSVGSGDDLVQTIGERDDLIRDGYVLNVDLDHTIGYGHWHSEKWWTVRLPRAFAFLFPTSDEPNTVLDAVVPPRITSYQVTGGSNVVSWTSYRLRTYSLEGATDLTYSAGMTWSNVLTLPPEQHRWNYPTGAADTTFHFFRVRELAVPNWPN